MKTVNQGKVIQVGQNKRGNSPLYENSRDLERKIDEYFEGGAETRMEAVGKGKSKKDIEVAVPTITGLALYLGFASRQSFYDYEKKPNYTYVIKKARTLIERHYEEQLQVGNTVGAIYALKNMGWSDRKQHEYSGPGGKPIEHTELTDLERAKRLAHLLDCARQRKRKRR